ncbi:MAG TPA: P-loop NTPase fold protein [Thermoanaerobaculia bacterium]|nr:P-loop NTPase fold protein [Thermoanaerobaculia bacterium]
MERTLAGLDLELDPRVDNLISLSLAVQELRANHPDAEKRSATRDLTRSAVLYALGELDPRVRKVFEEAGMDWPSFQDLLGLDKAPAPSPRTDSPLDSDLREALVAFQGKYPERKSIDLPAIALAIVESVRMRPRDGRLPNRLRKLGVDFERAHSRLTTLVEESLSGARGALSKAGPEVEGTVPLVYISYSHTDESWLKRLLDHLSPHVRAARFRVWYDLLLRPGEEWEPKIEEVHNQARIVIQLISPDYLASETIATWELPRLLECREKGGLRFMPLLVRPAVWQALPWLREIQLFPPRARPLANHRKTEIDRLLSEFANEVAVAAAEELNRPGPQPSPERGEPRPEDRVPTLLDDPSQVDRLNRRPFAEVMAIRLSEIWGRGTVEPAQVGAAGAGSQKSSRTDLDSSAVSAGGSFAIHIHGPWGAGKTSVLNFMREKLESTDMGQWVVIDFNAWRHQRIRPPWWSLIRQVYQQALTALKRQKDPRAVRRLRWRWLIWRVRADWLPTVLAGLAILLIVLFVGAALFGWAEATPAEQKEPQWAKTVDIGLKVITTLLAAWAGVLAFGRSMLFGSARAAQSYMDLAQDPMGPIATLFEKLVGAVGRPLVIFIDDLDRCEGDYVVELLEGVQVLFRRAQATYVVAADKDWIRVSFEKKYSDFTASISEPGRPLGYLFLDKLFQISATLPQLSPTLREGYWEHLLKIGVTAATAEEETRKAEANAEQLLKRDMTPEAMERVIEEYQNDPVQQQGLRAVAAKRISTQTAERRRAHFLQDLAGLLEPNPRAMKRLINAYGIHQAVNFLEGRRVDPDALALWTIIEMRWPLLAECLADSPDLVSQIGRKTKPQDSRIPEGLRDLFMSSLVQKVVKGEGVEPSVSLDVETIERVVGTSKNENGAGSE